MPAGLSRDNTNVAYISLAQLCLPTTIYDPGVENQEPIGLARLDGESPTKPTSSDKLPDINSRCRELQTRGQINDIDGSWFADLIVNAMTRFDRRLSENGDELSNSSSPPGTNPSRQEQSQKRKEQNRIAFAIPLPCENLSES